MFFLLLMCKFCEALGSDQGMSNNGESVMTKTQNIAATITAIICSSLLLGIISICLLRIVQWLAWRLFKKKIKLKLKMCKHSRRQRRGVRRILTQLCCMMTDCDKSESESEDEAGTPDDYNHCLICGRHPKSGLVLLKSQDMDTVKRALNWSIL